MFVYVSFVEREALLPSRWSRSFHMGSLERSFLLLRGGIQFGGVSFGLDLVFKHGSDPSDENCVFALRMYLNGSNG